MAPVRPFCVITVLLLVLLAVLPAQAHNGASLNGLDEFGNKAIRNREVPGLAIAIVKDDYKVPVRIRFNAEAVIFRRGKFSRNADVRSIVINN